MIQGQGDPLMLMADRNIQHHASARYGDIIESEKLDSSHDLTICWARVDFILGSVTYAVAWSQ